MRRIFTLVSLGALFAICVPGMALAGLAFEKDTVEVTGRADQEVIVVEFPFSNTGTEPVKVVDVASSCGCTTTDLTKKDYAPGEKGTIVARFTVGDRQGRQLKTITVKTNEQAYALKLVATLPVRLQAVPRLVVFRPDELGTKEIKLSFDADGPVTVEGIESLHPKFKVEVVTIKAGREYTVRVTPTAGLDQPERANIRVRTKGASGREYTDMLYVRFAP